MGGIDIGNPTGSGWIDAAAADDSPSVFDSVASGTEAAEEKPKAAAEVKAEEPAAPVETDTEAGEVEDDPDGDDDPEGDEVEGEGSDDPEKPGESEDGKPKDGEGAAADAEEVIEALPVEALAKANADFEADAQNTKDAIAMQFAPIAAPLIQQRAESLQVVQAINNKLYQVDEATGKLVDRVDADGFRVELTEPERLLYNEHKSILRETERDINKLKAELDSKVQSAIFDKSLEANIKAYKPLANLVNEVKELVAKGYQPSSVTELHALAKALHETRNGKTPAGPKMTKQQVEQAAIEKNIAAKQRAKVSAGKGGSSTGKVSGAAGKSDMPAHLQAHFNDLARAVSVG